MKQRRFGKRLLSVLLCLTLLFGLSSTALADTNTSASSTAAASSNGGQPITGKGTLTGTCPVMYISISTINI